MMTDTNIQQITDTNGQTLVTQTERDTLIQKLSPRCSLDGARRIENAAYEKSRGIKPMYFKMIPTCIQEFQNAQQQNRLAQQQQAINNNVQFVNQPINIPQQQASIPIVNHSQSQINPLMTQQPRFSTVQQSFQTRMTNPQTNLINNQPIIPNQGIRLREPQKFNQQPINPISYSTQTNIPTIDISGQNYTSQSQINNSNINDYLSQQPNRYGNQTLTINPRPRTTIPTTNLNGNFSQQSIATATSNSNDILHQFLRTNPTASSMTTNTSSTGDRLLQQILTSHNDGTSNKPPLSNRQSILQQQQPAPPTISQPIRPPITTNSNINSPVNLPLRSSLLSQQRPPSPSINIMPIPTQTSNVPIQPSNNVPIQHSPLNNNNNGLYSANPQVPVQPASVPMGNSSTPLLNNYTSPINRSAQSSVSGSISSPDEETTNLIKYFKENINKLQTICQKLINEGNLDKARNAQAIHQQMVQFINNPTYESLPTAKHIRDMLERYASRSQQSNSSTTNVQIPTATLPPANELNQFEKALTEYLSRDQKKRLTINKLFVEPLSDVVNGVPHKKIRLDIDNNPARISKDKGSSSFLSDLNDELNSLSTNRYLIESFPLLNTKKLSQFDEEYLNKNGIILRCKLLESSNPLIPPLQLKIPIHYPEEQPEILSLTKTMPPKLEFSDGHLFFEQLSTIFVSHLFKLPAQHRVTDILHIWYQSVQSAL